MYIHLYVALKKCIERMKRLLEASQKDREREEEKEAARGEGDKTGKGGVVFIMGIVVGLLLLWV